MKTTLKAMFDSFGFAPATTMRAAPPDPAAHLAGLFAATKIDLVIDHGADPGQFGDFLRKRVGYAGSIVSFEAIGAPFNALKSQAAADGRWETQQASLGARVGQLPLNVIDLKDFRAAGAASDTARVSTPCGVRIRREIVPVLTVDEVLPPLLARTGAKRVFLRLGGGNARDILKGAERMLCKIVALQTELNTKETLDGAPHYLAMLSYLEAKHFSPDSFFRANRPGPLPASFDCCLINTASA